MTTTLETTDTPDPDELALLGRRLAEFNDADVGASEKLALAVFVRDEARAIVGGVSGYTAWGWLYVQWLWVDASQRGKGMAGRMLAAAEAEAIDRGCHGALIDTFSPVAAKTYERQGYRRFGELADFPVGRSRIFLQKRLSAGS
ncbi:MAG: GNAT family N-acetyltransferase [Devosia nanyangense]|uniref:GNAT family N-acetyltransferase n=1 Tax=Devosia nanyangense TaxID=1228055 RepID=A0A933L2K8_9HYPH|nr:GNAT family N-acetyltransferase [Devosia nanyangense]